MTISYIHTYIQTHIMTTTSNFLEDTLPRQDIKGCPMKIRPILLEDYTPFRKYNNLPNASKYYTLLPATQMETTFKGLPDIFDIPTHTG